MKISMNQEEKIQVLRAKIKALEEENTKYKEQKTYGLVWENEKNKEKIVEDCKTKLPILERVKDKEIITDKTKPMNLMIEGDNYHALTCLNYTHKGKIDVIYIDPPYNTGAKDWKYNNDYVDSEDRFRHSKWLNMMRNRLILIQGLLSKRGVFICTIDKNEQANLGVLLQEVFNDKEIVCVTIIHNHGGIQGKNFSHTNEFAYFIYPQSGNFISTLGRDDIAPMAFRDWGKENSKREASKTCFYSIFIQNESIISFGNICPENFHPQSSNVTRKDGMIEVYPIDQKGIERKWRFGRETVESIKKELVCKEVKGVYSIFREKKDYRWKTVWIDTKYNANVYGTKLLNNIIKTKFPYPKSLYAVMDCVKAVIHNKENSTILDFFAGSGTTGHAVLELNKEDGGNRQFILCTNNENNNGNGHGGIAEAVCYPRIQKVIQGYNKNSNSEWVEGLGGNLHYFKADENSFISIETLKDIGDKKRLELTLKAGELIAIRENIFDQKEHSEHYQIFENDSRQVAIYFREEHTKLEALIEKLDEKKEKIVYLFGWGKLLLSGDDLGHPDITIKDIPEPIIRIYQEINR